MTYPRLTVLILSLLFAALGCSRSGEPSKRMEDDESAYTGSKGSDAAIGTIRAAVRALSQRGASVDSVAAEMKGVIKVRKKNNSLIHYDGYRATLITPGDRVTKVIFDLVEAKPTVSQLSEELGTPKEFKRGMRYEQSSEATGARIAILAETASRPPDESSLVKRIIVEGAR